MVSQLRVSRPDSDRPTDPRSVHFLHAIAGTIQVFTATHRSFFTNVMVQALRAAGQGMPVLVVQFLKGGIDQGPDQPMQLGPNLDWLRCEAPCCFQTETVDPQAAAAVVALWQHTEAAVMAGQYSLVVLDELSLAIQRGLVPEAAVVEFLQNRPPQVDVILTGPQMPATVLDMADQVTQFRRNFLP